MVKIDFLSMAIGYVVGVFFCYTTYSMIMMENDDDNG